MLRELFVPNKLFGRRLIAQKTIGISLDSSHVAAALVHKTPGGTTIEHLERQPLPSGDETYEVRAAAALAALYHRLPAHDNVVALLPASQVIFRELTLPLASADKIAMVIEFELEELLPFSIEKAVVDFVITAPGKESTVLCAAVQEKDLAALLDIYHKAGIEPQRITIDILALYDIYLQTASDFYVSN